MSTEVSANVLKNFLVNNLGIKKLDRNQAQEYDIDRNKFNEADQDENNFIDVDEILDNKDLYAQFATMFVEEMEANNDTDPEKEKEKAVAIKDKGQKQA